MMKQCGADDVMGSQAYQCTNPVDPEDQENAYCTEHAEFCQNGNDCQQPACPDHCGAPDWTKKYWPLAMSEKEHWEALLA